jgi:hypothetical protein
MRKLGPLSVVLSLSFPMVAFGLAHAAEPAAPAPANPAPAQAAPAPAPTEAAPSAPEAQPEAKTEAKKRHGGGPSLSIDPSAPQQGKLLVSPVEVVAPPEENTTGEWKFDITGYFRAPLRMSWGPPTTQLPAGTRDQGTQLRTPPLVPDWNYIDWRYTNSMVGPWTELNFHYGNSRVKATVQIASYNLTDPGYRRLEANLGINQAFLTINWPELVDENSRFTLTVGGFTNRYGAAGRYDGGKYETYLFGRTHIAGETGTFEYDVGDWTLSAEEGFGGKLEPIPFIGPPMSPAGNLSWNPYPGPVAQESTFVLHGHLGAAYKKMVLIGLHYIDTFANDNERAGGYTSMATPFLETRRTTLEPPHIKIWGAEVKLLGGALGDGYLGYAHLDALNAEYLGDAIESIHSFGGWQLHDNYFGPAGTYGPSSPATGKVDTVEFQHVFSFGQLFRYPQAFWGDGPDLIAAIFAMYNKVSGAQLASYNHSRFKAGAELTYLPLPWFGIGGRYDVVDPNLDNTNLNFSVFSPRIFLRSAFVTHEQILIQYSRYFYGSEAAVSQFPYNGGGADYPHNVNAQALGADKNAMTIAAIIWF